MSGIAQYDSPAANVLLKIIKIDITSFTVPASVKEIRGGKTHYDSAFYPCAKSIQTVNFEPDSELTTLSRFVFALTQLKSIDMTPCTKLTTLGYAAFHRCYQLTDVKLPPNLKEVSSGSFSYCNNLASLDIPDSVESFSRYDGDVSGVFASCKKLKTVNIGVNSLLKRIESHAFLESGLESIYIPKDLEFIGGGVFLFSQLKKIDVSDQNTIFSTDGYVLFQNNTIVATLIFNTEEYTIPENALFGSHAFRSSRFSKINFPDKKYDLSFFCFAATHFKTIELPSQTSFISDFCFSESKLESIVIPNSVQFIGASAFHKCTYLVNITLSSILDEIKNSAFAGSSSLLYIEIPYDVTKFGQGVFTGCNKALVVNFTNTDRFKIENNLVINDGKTIVEYFGNDPNYDLVIPSFCTAIGNDLFKKATLKSISFNNTDPETSITFGTASFEESVIKEVYCPPGLKSIGNNCFKNCKQLWKIVISGKLTKIPEQCFSGCVLLNTVQITTDTINKIEKYAFYDTPKLVDFDLTNVPLQSIATRAFSKCGIKTFVVPSTITELDKHALFEISSTHLVINSKIRELPMYFIANSVDLISVELGDYIEIIGEHCFEGCTSLREFTLSKTTSTIHMFAFAGCTLLNSITIPIDSNLTRIWPFAFNDCTSFNKFNVLDVDNFYFDTNVLMDANKTQIIFYIPVSRAKTFVVPGTIQSINSYAFDSCYNLREVIIPDGVITKIGANAFSECINLKRIILPKSLEVIDADAFKNCNRLDCGSVIMEEKIVDMAKAAGISEDVLHPHCITSEDYIKFGVGTCRRKNVPYLHIFAVSLYFLL